jgi:SAM-dependent methyltransferase
MINDAIKEQCILESKDFFLVKHPDRIKDLGEVFTPTWLVLEILGQMPGAFWEQGKTYLDPTCGNGQFLAAVLIIKMELGHTDALSTVYGVDIMPDNVEETRQRLIDIAGDTPQNWEIVKNNILCKDGLTYDYSFGDSPAEKLFAW